VKLASAASKPPLFVCLVTICSTLPALAQQDKRHSHGVVSDWSHQHLIYSSPGTADEAMQNGTYNRWLRIMSDLRFQPRELQRRHSLLQPCTAQAIGTDGVLETGPRMLTSRMRESRFTRGGLVAEFIGVVV
jgi:hypothetical protein